MFGLMQDRPLLISSLLDHAERYHPNVEIVSATCEGPVVRSNYATLARRARQLAQALQPARARLGRRRGLGGGGAQHMASASRQRRRWAAPPAGGISRPGRRRP